MRIPSKGFPFVFGDLAELQFALANFNSVVMISGVSGKAITYDVNSGSFGELPALPLQTSASEPLELEQDLESESEEEPPPMYRAKLMNLSLRNTLSRCSVTSSSLA